MNKRIRKKRAKAEWRRDRSKLIANFLVMMYPGLNRFEYLEMARPLFELDRDALIDLVVRETEREILRRSPLRKILPRKMEAVAHE